MLCDVRLRGGGGVGEGKRGKQHFCLVSRPACESRMRESELVEEEEIVLMCAFLLIRER